MNQERIEIQKLRHENSLILGFSIGGGIDQDPGQNPFSEDKADKVRNNYQDINDMWWIWQQTWFKKQINRYMLTPLPSF